ncbi:MAG TPA: hypothetical protein VK507_15835 [Iamia sp.]|nr:hypothetical protein [Iamia sp.]
MTEGPTSSSDGPPKDTARHDPSGDETVAFAPETDLPEPLPVSAPPPPPGVSGEPTATAASESKPWRTRPVPPSTPTPGGPGAPSSPGGPGGAAGTGAPRRDASNTLTAVAVGGVVVLVVVIVLMAVVLGGSDDDGEEVVSSSSTTPTTAVPTTPSTTPPPSSSVPATTDTTAPPTTLPAPTAPPVTASPGAGELPAGLLCRDLLAQGVDYDLAVAYWLQEGRPPQNDEDLDGVPCETVYPATAVEAVWGPQGLDEEEGLAADLFCRDLVAEGLDYNAAVAYWFEEGQPARMDDDGNGRPCETVYSAPEVEAFWS